MTIIAIIREHVESGAPWDEHGRCHIVLSTGDATALRSTQDYQRGARYLRDVEAAESPAGCRYVATLQFTRPVNVYEWLGEMPPTGTVAHMVTIPRPRWKSANWDAVTAYLMAVPADPEQPPEQTPQH